MKSLIKLIFLIGLIGSALFAVTAFAANFADTPSTHKNAFAIQTLKESGIVNGYSDGNFQPDKHVSRAEALAIVLKATGIIVQKISQKIPFTDVTENMWFFPMVQKGFAMEKLKGYEDKTFRPNNPLTLPEALALTLSFFNISTKGITIESPLYSGFDTEAWYAKYASYAKDQNLIEPDEKGFVDTKKGLTRGEFVEMIYRMRNAQQTKKPFDITSGWIVISHPENFWKLKHPADWEIFKGLRNSVIWKRDNAHGQVFFTRIFPETARISLSVQDNPNNFLVGTYFANMKIIYQKAYPKEKVRFTELTLSGKPALKISIPARRIIDLMIGLPTKQFLIMYGEYGEAHLGLWYEKQLESIMMSYEYVEKPPVPPLPPLADRMGTLREQILIEGKWNEIAQLFPDKKVIHTDAIGIGTGPIDYYYSKEANHTIKLERNSKTILNIREGETSGF